MSNKQIHNLVLSSILVFAMAVPMPSFAYGGTAWGPLAMVTIYRGSERKGALIQPSATFTNNDGCAHPENLFIDFSTAETPDGRALYAMALAAQLAGSTVSIGTNGCSTEGFPMVYGINLK